VVAARHGRLRCRRYAATSCTAADDAAPAALVGGDDQYHGRIEPDQGAENAELCQNTCSATTSGVSAGSAV